MTAESTTTTLCDYFAVVGFNRSNGLQVDRNAESATEFAGTSSPPPSVPTTDGTHSYQQQGVTGRSPLDRAYEAKVLAHYPHQREAFPFIAEVASVLNLGIIQSHIYLLPL